MKVSVIIPTYNYAEFILDAIKSIENQSYNADLIEVIVIDDGSTDDTPILFENYKSSLNIIYHYQENQGKAHATQRAINLCTGEIIFNLDADDYYYPNKLRDIIKIYETYPTLNYVGHVAETILDGQITKREYLPLEIKGKLINGNDLILYFLKHKVLYGGGSTFSAKSSQLKKHIIPSGVDMYIDEYLIYIACLNGVSYLSDECYSVWRDHKNNFSYSDAGKKKIKSERLIKSSDAMLNALIKFPQIYQLYYLKHLDRHLNHLEKFEKKKAKDVLTALKAVLSHNYSLKLLYQYRIFSRLLPTQFLNALRRIR